MYIKYYVLENQVNKISQLFKELNRSIKLTL